MRLVRISLLAMSLGAFAVAGCGGADEPEDTTPATNDNDGFTAGGEDEAGESQSGGEGTQHPDPEPDDPTQPTAPSPTPTPPPSPPPPPQPRPTP